MIKPSIAFQARANGAGGLVNDKCLAAVGTALVVKAARAPGAKQARRRLVRHAIAVGIDNRDVVAIVLFAGDDFAEVVVFAVVNRPVEGRALGPFAADFGGDGAVAPIVERIGDAVGRPAPGVLRRLSEIAVADATAVVDVVADLDHVVADSAAAGRVAIGGAVVVRADPVAGNAVLAVEYGLGPALVMATRLSMALTSGSSFFRVDIREVTRPFSACAGRGA